VELDTASLEIRGERRFPGSALLELNHWIEALVGRALIDDLFGRLSPALGLAEPPSGALAALAATRPRRRDAAASILDNVSQFRFYSGWRGAVERRRRQEIPSSSETPPSVA
jgi:hypothetical protein